MAINFGALAGGIGAGYDRQTRLQMDQERAAREKEVSDLQIAGLKRNEGEAQRKENVLRKMRDEGQAYYRNLVPEAGPDISAASPDIPVAEGMDASAAGIPSLKREAPQISEWERNQATVDTLKHMAGVAAKEMHPELADEYTKKYAEANGKLVNEAAQGLYRDWAAARTPKDKEAVINGMQKLYDRNWLDGKKVTRITTGVDEKNSPLYTVELDSGGDRQYRESDIPKVLMQLANPEKAMELAMAQAAAERKAAIDEREAKVKEGGLQQQTRRNDIMEEQNPAKIAGLIARAGRDDRYVPGGGGGSGVSRQVEARENRIADLMSTGMSRTEAINKIEGGALSAADLEKMATRRVTAAASQKKENPRVVVPTFAQAKEEIAREWGIDLKRINPGSPGINSPGQTSGGAMPRPQNAVDAMRGKFGY